MLLQIGELLTEVAKVELLDWAGRSELVGCICDLVLFYPTAGEVKPKSCL